MSESVREQRLQRRSLSPFYGYPPDVIARWCCVSIETARHFKSGRRKPSVRALKLFRLHAEGKILGDEWRGWRVAGRTLFDAAGKAVTAEQLAIWEIVWQLAAARDPDGYHALLDRLSVEARR